MSAAALLCQGALMLHLRRIGASRIGVTIYRVSENSQVTATHSCSRGLRPAETALRDLTDTSTQHNTIIISDFGFDSIIHNRSFSCTINSFPAAKLPTDNDTTYLGASCRNVLQKRTTETHYRNALQKRPLVSLGPAGGVRFAAGFRRRRNGPPTRPDQFICCRRHHTCILRRHSTRCTVSLSATRAPLLLL